MQTNASLFIARQQLMHTVCQFFSSNCCVMTSCILIVNAGAKLSSVSTQQSIVDTIKLKSTLGILQWTKLIIVIAVVHALIRCLTS